MRLGKPQPAVAMRAREFTRRSAFQALLGGSVLAIPASAAVDGFDPLPVFPLTRLFDELAIAQGPLQGAYRSTPNGPINWYFANLGLFFMVETAPDSVRAYLNAYLRAADPARGNIFDVAPDLTTRVRADSDDAYAGTFLRLAVRYVRATGDSTWWNSNCSRLKGIAYFNVLTQVKSNGLVRCFQAPAQNGIGYLMDQCEVYAGARDFAEYLLDSGDADARYYAGFPANLGNSIHQMFDPVRNLWNWCDVDSPDATAWYPNMTAQIYPHLCDVHSADAPGDYYRLHRGFDVLRQGVPDWNERPQDLYPWLVVGYYAAACQKDSVPASKMLRMARQYYLPGGVNTGRFTIADLGYVSGILREMSHVSGPAL